ncbi:hypothetical protein FGG08_003664 [Glutinoglossum americanum]|uniref:SUI1 domain-containing protein n=1 Tax=Glutinoglossum americanum TaxID=1670608 RepID=A0A9P8I755_9PEZI|nr:hypothetical protein FGG08_003664 [Glutinoglossum americanum]
MFKKKPNFKPLSPLRSSDRRKLAEQIISDFRLKISNETEPQTELAALRNSLLPDSSLTARFTTTAGPDLKIVSGTIYVGAHPGDEQRILWVRMEERMFPTVYTLWHNPGLVPLLHTPEPVLQKLRNGADLMTPGLARGPPFPTAAIRGSVVAIASLETPSVPMVVGVCEINVSELKAVAGEKGRAVRGMHWEGDELWAWSSGGKGGGVRPTALEGWDTKNGVWMRDLETEIKQLGVDDADIEETEDDGGVPLGEVKGNKPGYNEFSEGEDVPPSKDSQVENKELSTKEVDEAFKRAFLFGLHQHLTVNGADPGNGLDFPLTSSFVIASLVLPFLPTFTPAQTSSLQLKKTSWKNAKKFLKALDKEGLIKTKDRSGGEIVVLDIDWNESAIADFVPYQLPTKDRGNSGGRAGTERISALGSAGQELRRIGLFKPKEKLAPLFKAAEADPKSLYLASEIRPIITAYIESESLVSTTNKRLVAVNPVLANTVFSSDSSTDREVIAKGTVPRDRVIDRVLENCSPFWALLRSNETKDDVKPKAGRAPNIQILLETRSGNKTVTKVSGVETYLVNPSSLAAELQKTCASSTSVGQLVGSSPKNPVMEVMVQGPQTQAVIKALEKNGVNRQWIDVVDKTKGKKR